MPKSRTVLRHYQPSSTRLSETLLIQLYNAYITISVSKSGREISIKIIISVLYKYIVQIFKLHGIRGSNERVIAIRSFEHRV